MAHNNFPMFAANSAAGTNTHGASPNNVRICPLAKRYVYKGFLALVSLFWLSSCAVANNKIGFDLSFDKPLSSECVESIFPQIRGISEIVTTSSGYNGFSLGDYEVGLFFTKIDNLVSGYKIKIDGMFQLESYESFTQKAIKLNNEIRVHFEEGCLD